MPEMARLLGTTRSTVYSILNNPNYKEFFDFVVIADKKRITKESFQRFLDGQNRYHLDARIEYSEVAAEENMALADFRRKKLFKSGARRGNGNKNYLTRAEFEDAFYNKKNLDPQIHEASAANTVQVPEGVDAELLSKVLSNPEMAALLSSLAKSMQK